MWLVRLRMPPAEPLARGEKRLRTGPAPITASFTISDSALSEKLFSASAIAVLSVLPMSWAAFLGVKVRMSRALDTGRPWISRATSRAFFGESDTYLVVLLTSMERRT